MLLNGELHTFDYKFHLLLKLYAIIIQSALKYRLIHLKEVSNAEDIGSDRLNQVTQKLPNVNKF